MQSRTFIILHNRHFSICQKFKELRKPNHSTLTKKIISKLVRKSGFLPPDNKFHNNEITNKKFTREYKRILYNIWQTKMELHFSTKNNILFNKNCSIHQQEITKIKAYKASRQIIKGKQIHFDQGLI